MLLRAYTENIRTYTSAGHYIQRVVHVRINRIFLMIRCTTKIYIYISIHIYYKGSTHVYIDSAFVIITIAHVQRVRIIYELIYMCVQGVPR